MTGRATTTHQRLTWSKLFANIWSAASSSIALHAPAVTTAGTTFWWPHGADEFAAVITEARHLGEITLATQLALVDVLGMLLRLTLTGPQRLRIATGERLVVRLDLALVHVMPSKQL